MDNSLNIRFASEKDYDKVLELASEVFGYYDYYYISSSLYRTRIILLELNNEVIGFAQLYLVKIKELGLRIGVIYYMGVKVKYQGRGYGKILLDESEKYFIHRKADLIIATTRKENIRVQKLFSSTGYMVYDIFDLSIRCGWDLVDLLLSIAYAYEDDVIMIKQLTNKVPCLTDTMH